MFQFVSTWVETRLTDIKEYVYYLWQISFLHQFIPLVHHLLLLRMKNSDNSVQNMNCGPYGQRCCSSQFRGFQELCSGVPQNSVQDAKCPRLFSSHENIKSLRMCENFNSPTAAENIYSSVTAIKKPLTGRNRTGRGGCVEW